MEYLKGWWTSSSKKGVETDKVPKTSEKQNVDVSSPEIDKVSVTPVKQKDNVVLQKSSKSEATSETQTEYKTNTSVKESGETNIRPVLVDKLSHQYVDIKVITKLRQYLTENTYLQPQDCFVCKLLGTGFATVTLSTILLMDLHFASKLNVPKSRTRLTKAAVFSFWLLYLQREWYNCLFTPPEEKKPRSFLEFERDRLRKIMEYFD